MENKTVKTYKAFIDAVHIALDQREATSAKFEWVPRTFTTTTEEAHHEEVVRPMNCRCGLYEKEYHKKVVEPLMEKIRRKRANISSDALARIIIEARSPLAILKLYAEGKLLCEEAELVGSNLPTVFGIK